MRSAVPGGSLLHCSAANQGQERHHGAEVGCDSPFETFLYSSYFHACRYQEPPKPFGGSGEPGEPVTTTVRDYDLKQVNAAFSPLFIGVAIMGCEWLLQVTS